MNKSKTAYDYRRVIALAQVLAGNDVSKLRELCELWNVKPAYGTGYYHGKRILKIHETVQRLAQHALEYSRETHHE